MRRSSFKTLMTRRIARAIGVTSLILPTAYACGGDVIFEPSGSGAAGSTGSTTDATTTNTTTNSSQTADVATSSSSGLMCTEDTVSAANGGGSLQYHYTVCLDDLNMPCPADANQAFAIVQEELGKECCFDGLACEYLNTVECGPYASGGEQCCFEIKTTDDGCAVPGRPYTVADKAVFAPRQTRADWGSDTLAADALPLAATTAIDRQQLAEQWTAHALAEHASIASFARFALELMALGAPADLLADAQQAASDEVKHTRMAFALASAFADEPVGPGVLPLGPLAAPNLVAFAVSTVKEGCINETLSTLLIAEQLAHATHPAVRKTLAAMVADETRHAELAWRTVAWAIREGGEAVRAAVRDAFAQAAVPSALPHTLSADAATLAPVPAADVARRVMRDGLATLVRPCAQALLAKPLGHATPSVTQAAV